MYTCNHFLKILNCFIEFFFCLCKMMMEHCKYYIRFLLYSNLIGFNPYRNYIMI